MLYVSENDKFDCQGASKMYNKYVVNAHENKYK